MTVPPPNPDLLPKLNRYMIGLNIAGLVCLALLTYLQWRTTFMVIAAVVVLYDLLWALIVGAYRRLGWDKPR